MNVLKPPMDDARIRRKLERERFVLPENSSFDYLHGRREKSASSRPTLYSAFVTDSSVLVRSRRLRITNSRAVQMPLTAAIWMHLTVHRMLHDRSPELASSFDTHHSHGGTA